MEFLKKIYHKKTYQVFIILFTVGIVLVSVISCVDDQSAKQEQRVDILLFGSHPLLLSMADGIEQGAQQRLQEIQTPKTFQFEIRDANFQVIDAAQQAKQAIARKPAAVVALGTPSIKAALVHAAKGTPIFFGASSDPAALRITKSDDPLDWRRRGAFQAPPQVYGIITDFRYDRMAKLIQGVSSYLGVTSASVRIGYPLNEAEPNSVLALDQLTAHLKGSRFKFVRAPVSAPTDTAKAARFLITQDVSLIQVGPDNTVAGGIGSILSAVQGKDLPVLASESESVRSGALAAYGVDFLALGKRLGIKLANYLLGQPDVSDAIELFSESKLYVNSKVNPEVDIHELTDSLLSNLAIDRSQLELFD